ncbi:EAL domain-containing protein [Rhodoferax sp.]|uniref:EAL domain-containing protein n=1 Tax=Rhodoferax sp. TaxID=50421 RepID=UPI00284CEA97|nr:EAL domain-containing protein [Rhodoferax sp.]MDR3371845.1 EAL domain-containing protein [Rhodoferax sp.]
MFEIFPWGPHLETGITLIDEQHHMLVGLLNRLVQQYIEGASEHETNAILGELSDYADYHFRSEEGIWQTHLSGDAWLDEHVQNHQRFFAHITELRSGDRPLQAVLCDLFPFLTQWLAHHILDKDKRMALVVLALQDGLGLEAAHQRAEEALRSNEGRWRLLLSRSAQAQASGSTLERNLSTLIDNLPAGLAVVDNTTHRFIFVNPWFCQMLGYSQDELLKLPVKDIHRPEDLVVLQAKFPSLTVDNRKVGLELPLVRKNGTQFICYVERIAIEFEGQVSAMSLYTDVTERIAAKATMQASELHLRTLVNTIPDLIWLKDVNGVFLSCNPAFERLYGVPEAFIVGKTDYDFVPQELADSFRENDRAAMTVGGPTVNEEWLTFADSGQGALMETTKVPMRTPDGQLLGVLGISHNITERRAAEAALEVERLRLQNAIEAAQAGTWEVDFTAGLILFNERTAIMLGYEQDKVRERGYDEYVASIHPEDRVRVQQSITQHMCGESPRFEAEMRLPHQDGHWVWCRCLGRVTQRDATGQPRLVAGIIIDISEHKAHQAQLKYLTQHDALTGLPNRKLFVETLALAMCRCAAPHKHLGVAYLDLDGFAAINDVHGQELGNQLIVELGRRLVGGLLDSQYLAHIGGDEFAVLLGGLDQTDAHVVQASRLLTAVAQPLELDGLSLSVTASIGVTLYPQNDKVDAEQLLRQSDQAMYQAKLAGKNCFRVFDPVKDETTREQFLRLGEIRRALVNQEFVLFYQPKVHLKSGEVIGFEALIRWQQPERGLVPPGLFIPLLERHPLAITLGNWVIETALAQLAQWQTQGIRTVVSVNIDGMQLHDPDFVERLQGQLRQQPTVSPSQLELEILETGALENMPHVSALIGRLQALGIECALDDFGTGYSSLTFLKQLAAHTIKIDQSFVRGMQDDAEHAAIVYSVLGLAHNFDRRPLAEGVETEALGQMLIEFGCEYGQGYAIARPMPSAEVAHWLAQWHAPDSWAHSEAVSPGDMSILLAEVEHQACLHKLYAFATGKTTVEPAAGQICRFGQWLTKPATQQRFAQHAGFATVTTVHARLHQQADLLLDHIRAGAAHEQVAQLLADMDAHSQQMHDAMRMMRQARPDAEGPIPGFSLL